MCWECKLYISQPINSHSSALVPPESWFLDLKAWQWWSPSKLSQRRNIQVGFCPGKCLWAILLHLKSTMETPRLLYHSGGNLNREHLKSSSRKGHFLHLLHHLLISAVQPRNWVKSIPGRHLVALFTVFFPSSIQENVSLIIFPPRFLHH